MTGLSELRGQLSALRRRRRDARWGSALCGLALTELIVLSIDFLIDWTFEPSHGTRLWMAGGCLIAIAWAWRKFLAPLSECQESDLEMALLVERRQGIDSDLVAALQFESPEATRWGSGRLRQAVVEYVGEFGREIDVFTGFTWRPLARRITLLACGLLVVGLLAGLFPGHAAAFVNRFCLGRVHYPTRTRIEQLTVNGQVLTAIDVNQSVPCPAGRSVLFAAHCDGALPQSGHTVVVGVTSGTRAEVIMAPVANADSVGAPLPSPPTETVANYSGLLPRLDEDADIQFYLGDAWTDPIRLRAVPLPLVEVELHVIPPAYATSIEQPPRSGETAIAVLEGSRVELFARSANKPLARAWLTIDGVDHPLRPSDDAGRTWKLAADDTPLADVRRPVVGQLQIVDQDGFSLDQPLELHIRMRVDQPPRVQASMVTLRVLPTARPTIRYEADDDFGLARLRLLLSVMRENVVLATDTRELTLDDQHPARQRGELPLDLRSLNLAKGDRLTCQVEAVDHRGELAGRTTISEPVHLDVTDERGVLAAMLESDERLAEQLDAVIQRQINVGEMP